MGALNLDPAVEITTHHRVGRGASFRLTFEKNGQPWKIAGKTFRYTVKRWLDTEDADAPIKLELGSGIEMRGAANNLNQLEFTIDPAEAKQPPVKHFWEIQELTTQQTWFNGDFIFHQGKFSASGKTNLSGTINILDEVITWTLHLLAYSDGTFDTTFDSTFE